MPEITDELQKDIDERVAQIRDAHGLTPARVEGVEVALRELAESGEWPPPEDSDGDGVSDEMEAAVLEIERLTAEISQLQEAAKAQGGGDGPDLSETLDRLAKGLHWDASVYRRAKALLER